MKKLLSTLISAAVLATPMMVISAPAAAQSMSTPTATSGSFKFEAKRGGKKMKRKAKAA